MSSTNRSNSNCNRFVYAVGILSLASSQYTSLAFTPTSTSPQSTSTSFFPKYIHNELKSTSKSMIATAFKSSPVVVSEEAEALSHSETTLKLIPSYELFQILSKEEGGQIPKTAAGNSQRDSTVLKIGQEDTLEGTRLSDFIGCGGKTKIETLPDPFQMVEKTTRNRALGLSWNTSGTLLAPR